MTKVMKKTISLQLDEEWFVKLKELCKLQDRSMSALCRIAIIKFINSDKEEE